MHTLLYILLGQDLAAHPAQIVLLVGDVLALASAPSVLLRRKGRPTAALSWLLALFALPVLGVAAWWLFGAIHLERQRRRRRACLEDLEGKVQTEAWFPVDKRAAQAFCNVIPRVLWEGPQSISPLPPTAGNDLELLVDGTDGFAAMETAIRGAKHHIHAEYYIWNDDATGRRLANLLAERSQEGIEVRILVDAYGSPDFRGKFIRELQEAGCKVARFHPPKFMPWSITMNFRNHRKVLVVDGSVGFVGGMNIGKNYEHHWHDLALKIRGPAASQLGEVFLEDWYVTTREDLPFQAYLTARTCQVGERQADVAVVASGPDGVHGIHDALFLALSGAQQRILLTTPYFIPSASLTAALRSAAQRGVEIKLLLPGTSDLPLVRLASRSFYRQLLSAGIEIYEYQPRILHAKATVVDDDLTILGTANVDVRSFKLNFEVSCFAMSKQLNADLARVFFADLKSSKPIGEAYLAKASWARSLVESVAHLLSPLL